MIQFDKFVDTFGGGKTFPLGIHEAVEISKFDVTETHADITFTDGVYSISKRLFSPATAKPLNDETEAQAIERAENANAEHLVKILYLVEGADYVKALPQMPYEKFLTLFNSMMPKLKGVKFNLKVGLSPALLKEGSKVGQLGRFADYLEVHTPGKKPKLAFSKWERANFFPEEGATNKSEDQNLPF